MHVFSHCIRFCHIYVVYALLTSHFLFAATVTGLSTAVTSFSATTAGKSTFSY